MSQSSDPYKFVKDFVIGGVAASIGVTVVAPIERVQLLLQIQGISKQINNEKQYKGENTIKIRLKLKKTNHFMSFPYFRCY